MVDLRHADMSSLSRSETADGLRRAAESSRRRHAKILHSPGDEFNRVFNFIMADSYMQPHQHPGPEKIEKITVMSGIMAVFLFTDQGDIGRLAFLEKGVVEMIEIPAFTWHTYVMMSHSAVSYETMMGQYEPRSWKEFARWAPAENTPESVEYLASLKSEAASRMPAGQPVTFRSEAAIEPR